MFSIYASVNECSERCYGLQRNGASCEVVVVFLDYEADASELDRVIAGIDRYVILQLNGCDVPARRIGRVAASKTGEDPSVEARLRGEERKGCVEI